MKAKKNLNAPVEKICNYENYILKWFEIRN